MLLIKSFFSLLHDITQQNRGEQITDSDTEGNTVDSELAEQAGRQQAGRQQSVSHAPPGNGWKREHESTFLNSDWPSFKNTVRALAHFPLFLFCPSLHHHSGAAKQIMQS